MPRIGSRIYQQLGSYNPNNPGRQINPAIQVRGPAQPVEFFNDPDLDPSVRRALLALQSNTRQAFSQVRGSPLAYSNIIRWNLTQGAADGASPNVIAHLLGQPASGARVLCTYGGYVTAEAVIPNPPTADLIQLWTQYTAFTGVSQVTADILVWA